MSQQLGTPQLMASCQVQDYLDKHAYHGLGRHPYLPPPPLIPPHLAYLFLHLRCHLALHTPLRLLLLPGKPPVPPFQEMLLTSEDHL